MSLLFLGEYFMPNYFDNMKWPLTNNHTLIKLMDAYKTAYWSWHGKYEQKF